MLLGFSRAIRAVGSAVERVLAGASVRLQSTTTATFTLPDDIYKLHKLEEGPSREVELTREDLLRYYREMCIIREMEAQGKTLYGEKKIRGFFHSYNGQEACAVGMEAAITKDDPVITAYRSHSWTYTRGVPVKKVLAELTARSTGVQKGKGGSMHMYAKNYYGGNGIVGTQIPLGAGIAFSLKYNNSDRLCVTLYGDGAANQGQGFEAFNMAALWKLPCLFVCENNLYGMGTSAKRAAACTDFYTRGDYIPGIWVEGQNILAVREATRWCAERIRAGSGPLVMELYTYRYQGHSMSDPGKSYRDKAEIDAVRKHRDPIKTAEAYAITGDLSTKEELKEISKEVKREVKEAVEFSLQGSELPLPELYTDIYVDQQDLYVRGTDLFTTNLSSQAAQ